MIITLKPTDYSFNAQARSITFLTTVPASLAHIKHVSNLTAGLIYFQPQAGLSRTGTLDADVLTLAWNTSVDNNQDDLLIIVDDGVVAASETAVDLTNTKLDTLTAKLPNSPALESGNLATLVTSLAALASANHADLAAILTKLSADPASQTTLAAVLAKLSSDPATQTTLAALASTNHTDLAAILAKLSADPATQTTLAAVLAKLNGSVAVTGTFWQATQPVSLAALPAGAATDAGITGAGGKTLSDVVTALGSLSTGGLTDTELRAAPVPVTASSLPLPTGASTNAGITGAGGKTLSDVVAALGSLSTGGLTNTELRASPVPMSATSLPLPTGAATNAGITGAGGKTLSDVVTALGSLSTGGLTNTELRAAPVPMSASSLPLPTGAATEATLSAQNTLIGAVTETAPTTDTGSSGLNGRLQRLAQRLTSLIAQLPASLGIKTSANSLSVAPASDATFAVSGTVTANTGLTQPLTDTQLRATALPVSLASAPLPTGAATNSGITGVGSKTLSDVVTTLGSPLQAGGSVSISNTVPVTGPLTDTQLRATALPVSLASAPLPSGAATNAGITGASSKTLTDVVTTLGSPLQAGGSVTVAGVATEATLSAQTALLGAVTETAPASDTASSGLNGRLQRIAQRLTSLIAQLPASLGIKTAANSLSVAPASDATFTVAGTVTANTGLSQPVTDTQLRAAPVPVSGTVTVSGAATETTLAAQSTLLGAVTETAPTTDTASSGLNGRLQRIAQRLTSLLTTQTDRSQKTQLTDGTNDVSVSTAIADAMSAAVNRLRVSAVNMAFNGTTVDAVRAGVIGDSGAATGYLNTIPATGAVSGASTVSSSAFENSRVIKASAGTLMMLSGYNSSVSRQFIQLFNATAVPADGTAPIMLISVFGQQPFSFSIPTTGMPFTTGICVSNSSTGPTKTIGSADCYFTAVIK